MIPNDQWLSQAKALSVGMRTRVQHLNERRKNLVIGNDPDKWWCYCQACKEGGVVDKQHVLLGTLPPQMSTSVEFPNDATLVVGSQYETPIARFLASKCMDFTYLPSGIMYSDARKRLLVPTAGAVWAGRDITERSEQKWLMYGIARCIGAPWNGTTAVVVEDLFSYYKLAWATRYDTISVVCALGTNVTDELTQRLMHANHVVWMFDGDAAGHKGAAAGHKRIKALGVRSEVRCAPDGKDPKDLDCSELRALLGGVL